MGTISTAIENTLRRIGTVAGISGTFVRAVWCGLSKEFGRFVDYRDVVKRAAVVSDDLPVECLDDMEAKYGLPVADDIPDSERIGRVIERASTRGSGGKDWLEAQIQAAGFPLYVIENSPQPEVETQFGDVQFGEGTQFYLMPKRINPLSVPGVLVTSSSYAPGGVVVLSSSQFGGTTQFGTTQFGSRDVNYIMPQPIERQLSDDPSSWSRVFFLSPFPDRLATESEMIMLQPEKLLFLTRLLERTKYLHLWCIVQAIEDVVLTTEADEILTTEDDMELVI